MTTDERFAVLSALIDREPVDPDTLAAVLEDRNGRGQLVDFVRLRAMAVRELAMDGQQEGRTSAFAEATADRSVRPVEGRVRAPLLNAGRLLRRAAAVLLPLALVAGGGLFYASWQDSHPPEPDRVVEFTPGVDWRLQ